MIVKESIFMCFWLFGYSLVLFLCINIKCVDVEGVYKLVFCRGCNIELFIDSIGWLYINYRVKKIDFLGTKSVMIVK